MAENNSSAPLLPCPFCGAAARMKPSTRGDYTSIACNSPCAGPLAIVVPNDQIEAGIAAWNTRAPQAVTAQAPAAVAVSAEKLASLVEELRMLAAVQEPEYPNFQIIIEEAVKVLEGATPEIPATEDSSAGDLAEAGRTGLCAFLDAAKAVGIAHLPGAKELAALFDQAEPFGYVNVYTGQFFHDVEPCRKNNGGHWRTVYAAPQAQPADALQVAALPPIPEDPLWKWFGLSYASWLTLPRVMMHAMPTDWKADMARLLNRWDETWKAGNLPDIRIQAVGDNGKITKMPEWLNNYRHPDHAGLENLKEPSARTSQDRAAMAAAQEGSNAAKEA